MDVWMYGCVGAWVYGCMGVWVHIPDPHTCIRSPLPPAHHVTHVLIQWVGGRVVRWVVGWDRGSGQVYLRLSTGLSARILYAFVCVCTLFVRLCVCAFVCVFVCVCVCVRLRSDWYFRAWLVLFGAGLVVFEPGRCCFLQHLHQAFASPFLPCHSRSNAGDGQLAQWQFAWGRSTPLGNSACISQRDLVSLLLALLSLISNPRCENGMVLKSTYSFFTPSFLC